MHIIIILSILSRKSFAIRCGHMAQTADIAHTHIDVYRHMLVVVTVNTYYINSTYFRGCKYIADVV